MIFHCILAIVYKFCSLRSYVRRVILSVPCVGLFRTVTSVSFTFLIRIVQIYFVTSSAWWWNPEPTETGNRIHPYPYLIPLPPPSPCSRSPPSTSPLPVFNCRHCFLTRWLCFFFLWCFSLHPDRHRMEVVRGKRRQADRFVRL